MPDDLTIPVPIALLKAAAPPDQFVSPSPPALPKQRDLTNECIYLGKILDPRDEEGNFRGCLGCHLRACDKHQTCSISRPRTDTPHCCMTCVDYDTGD